MVRLVWFPGHMDWELRKHRLGNTRANSQCGCSQSEVCTMCIPSYKNGGGANFRDSPSCTAWEHSYQIMYTTNGQQPVYLSSRLSVIQPHSHRFPERNRRYGDSLMTVIVWELNDEAPHGLQQGPTGSGGGSSKCGFCCVTKLSASCAALALLVFLVFPIA